MADERINGDRPTTEKPGRSRKMKIAFSAAVLLIAGLAIVGYWYQFLRGYVSTDDAVIDSDAVTVSSKILGRVTALNADEGDSVKAGDLLVVIDDSDLKAQEAHAQAGLDYVRQNVEVAKIALDRARDDFYRDSIQYKNHVITHEQFDHSGKAFELAQAQEAVAQSQVKTSQTQLAVIETQLASAKITAAFSGVVARKWVVPGDIVQPGQPIFTLYNLNDVWVTANFEETKLASIHRGDPVDISVDAYPDRKLTGTVDMIGAAAASRFSLIPPNNASGNFTKVTQRVPIKIAFTSDAQADPPGQPTLLPGMSVEVRIKTREK
jgi:membrane fusion protein (multidrug efflux system)